MYKSVNFFLLLTPFAGQTILNEEVNSYDKFKPTIPIFIPSKVKTGRGRNLKLTVAPL